MKKYYDAVIVGCGVAGCFTALHLPQEADILMITKADTEDSDSFLAQGGICVLKNESDYDAFYEDTMHAGHYENTPESVDIMIRSSRNVINQLIAWGVDFRRDENGELCNTKEGAHSTNRILFHDDVTGKEITSKLLAQVKKLPNVTLLAHTEMCDILSGKNGCEGVLIRDEEGKLVPVYARDGEIKIHPVDINKSDINIVSDYRTNSMYWAFNAVKQCGERAQEHISEEKKKNGPFFSLEEFIDRCVIKGSPVNKSVIENLIFAGAFDELENIQEPKDRLALIEMYRENKRVKILEDKDLLTNIMKVRKERNNWWWLLQQKRTSGFAFFDYYDLVNEYHMPKLDDETEFQDVSQIKFWDINSKKTRRAVIGGYVIEIIERKSKKGIFATIVLESNYEFINVTIFPELFEEYGEFLRGSKKNILLVNGVIVWDKFRGEYILQANVNSLFTVLT